jgi:hypothetical protein
MLLSPTKAIKHVKRALLEDMKLNSWDSENGGLKVVAILTAQTCKGHFTSTCASYLIPVAGGDGRQTTNTMS